VSTGGAVGPPTDAAPQGRGEMRLHAEGVVLILGGRRVLDGVDLVLGAGLPVALTGPSGSGKTVLCLVLGGALRPTTGRVWLERPVGPGEDESIRAPGGTAQAAGAPYAAGLILQSHGLVAGLTAEENVALPLQARHLERADIAARTARALHDVGLEKHASRPVDELSGGERQRVGIARALALEPTVLVADEPTSELDPGNRERVLGLLTALARRGRVVAIASDDPEIAAACGTVVALDHGVVAGRHVQPAPTP
jgi:putative ABC transport system ATP-binding protein